MRNHIFLAAAVVLAAFGSAFAASGTKPPQMVPKFHNLSSSTKPALSQGEIRYNALYIFVNVSSVARPHWHRFGPGVGF